MFLLYCFSSITNDLLLIKPAFFNPYSAQSVATCLLETPHFPGFPVIIFSPFFSHPFSYSSYFPKLLLLSILSSSLLFSKPHVFSFVYFFLCLPFPRVMQSMSMAFNSHICGWLPNESSLLSCRHMSLTA